jgi:hypothetical protein
VWVSVCVMSGLKAKVKLGVGANEKVQGGEWRVWLGCNH